MSRYNKPNKSEVGQWTPEEFVQTLDLYLTGGIGFKSLANMRGRTQTAVENTIKSDVPRNYRQCIDNWIEPARKRGSRTGTPWHYVERAFVRLMVKKGRSMPEMMVVLARSARDIAEELASTTPFVENRGFEL